MSALSPAAIAARAAAIAAKIPAEGIIPPLCIVPEGVPERWGRCMCCDDAMPAHRGGQCDLCNAAYPEALRQAGRLPPDYQTPEERAPGRVP